MDPQQQLQRIGMQLQNQLDPIEMPFYYLGLETPIKRFFAGTIATGGLLYAAKPSSLYYSDGTSKPWKLTSSEETAVFIPWWLYSLFVGFVISTFI